MSEKNKKSLNLLEKLILKFKKTKTTYSEKELERILEKKEKEITARLVGNLNFLIKKRLNLILFFLKAERW